MHGREEEREEKGFWQRRGSRKGKNHDLWLASFRKRRRRSQRTGEYPQKRERKKLFWAFAGKETEGKMLTFFLLCLLSQRGRSNK